MRAQAKFVKRIKPIRAIQSSLEKYHFRFSETYGIFRASRLIEEGRIAVVTNVEVGCGGRDGVVCA